MGDQSVHGKTYEDLLPYEKSGNVTKSFINEVVTLLVEFLKTSNTRDEKVIDFKTPEELEKLLDFSLPKQGETLESVLENISKFLKYVVRTGHPRFCNNLFGGIDISCVMGEWITATTNTSMYTFEMAPVYLQMERYVIEKMLSLFELSNGDGLFFPGGSLANIASMNLARHWCNPDLKTKGLFGYKPMKIFVSEEAHYSISKGAALLGFGTDNVVKIKTDEHGKMIASDLEQKIKATIEKNEQPFFVNTTAGTTVAGAFDPFNEIADICEKYKLWMHIDGAWGGSCIFSTTHKHFMSGCGRANSITWDAHKMFGATQQCTLLLTKKKGILKECHKYGAQYLFQKDRKLLYDTAWDSGDGTFQCGRRVDVLKLWLMWRVKGTDGIEKAIDKAFTNSKYFLGELKKRKEAFVLLREPQCTNVCFYYIPPCLRHLPPGKERDERLSKVAPAIKKQMILDGSTMFSYNPLKEHVNFFRMILLGTVIETQDMDFILDEVERIGKDIEF